MSHVAKSQKEKVSPTSSVSKGSRDGGCVVEEGRGKSCLVFFNP